MLDPEDFRTSSGSIIDWIDNYLNQIGKYPVKSRVRPGEIYEKISREIPWAPDSIGEIMKDFEQIILPGITHWQHPNFHAYFPANHSVESVLAEFLTAAIGAQCMIWDTSPAAAELEQRMVEWLRDAMGIPGYFEGVIQDSASTATLVAMLTAREVSTSYLSNFEGVPQKLRIYGSEETHSSIEKAAGICGIGRSNLVRARIDEKMRLDPASLEKEIISDREKGYQPCMVVATLGTTGTLAVDPLHEIAAICKKYRIWLHVDAAYAGTALLLPEYRWMIRGIEQVDSFVFNPHKWMFTNFDCSVYFVKNADNLIRTLEVLPEYLKTGTRGSVKDYRDWSVPLGRRFRALKLWFVMRSYGLEGIRKKLSYHIELNRYFSEKISQFNGFELAVEPFLNFTAFRLNPSGSSDPKMVNPLNERLQDEINRNGRLFLTHTKISGLHTLRMVTGQTYVEQMHVKLALDEIVSVAERIRQDPSPGNDEP